MRTGRPKMKLKEKRTERIPVMFTVEESQRIEQAAESAGMPVSSLVRNLVMDALKSKAEKKGKQ